MHKAEQHKPADRTQQQGLLTRIIKFIIRLPITVLITLLFSILVEWFVMHNYYPDLGAEHARQILQQDTRYLNQHFKDSLMGSKPLILAGETLRWVDVHIFKPFGIDAYKSKAKQERGWAWTYLMSAYTMVKVVLLRLCVLLLSLPGYVLFAMLGIITGLVERDLRKFGAGYESSDKFDLSFKLLGPALIGCFVLYMSWPDSINPALIIVPFAAMFGYMLHLAASNYKKRF